MCDCVFIIRQPQNNPYITDKSNKIVYIDGHSKDWGYELCETY